ncbi:4-hydroxybenzoate octaprenyltransferase [Pseudooceanicola sp. CBS1P-1]|uniref:4-hydroxybenzoate octaprenyltransferase n=1 Tax=Pseudooceanicola albus TaxID=2692189 RepID=A0A6L7G3P2_9RHOB|nr:MULTISPECIES: 4-hydroxybenzoate octaprenyltransferase [Pseudooceanicola]MBT9384868.1 4-hydroxybenzoate octaprenyltransferase [Pseudooceanicola endophyticus]MXN18138.1 4-hydroxybenzoate octaprenyltransferase [Pseudooceanicola albus]
MSNQNATPEDASPRGQVSDAVKGNWVDHTAPAWTRPYLRLSRADRPIGTWLLLLPCWWSLLLAMVSDGHAGWMDLWIFLGCGIGAVLMRGAGCTWNDITDRNFDGKVERTRSRPIPSGQVSVAGAAAWMVLQCLISFAILISFPRAAVIMGVISLLPVAVYPFAKRFTWWPQVFLGIAFNWGALLAWTAHTGSLGLPAVLMYLAGIAWTLFYDTIYAHQDKEDDALIGVKSTARLFMEKTRAWLIRFMLIAFALLCLSVLAAVAPSGDSVRLVVALLGILAWLCHLLWQLRRFDSEDMDGLLMLFRANRDAGLLPLPFFAVALFV